MYGTTRNSLVCGAAAAHHHNIPTSIVLHTIKKSKRKKDNNTFNMDNRNDTIKVLKPLCGRIKETTELIEEAQTELQEIREAISKIFPDNKNWRWRSDLGQDDDAVLVFDAMVLETCPKEDKPAHLAFLDNMMCCDHIAVVIENFVTLDKEIWNTTSILNQLESVGYRAHKTFKYKPDSPKLTKQRKTGFPFTLDATKTWVDVPTIKQSVDGDNWKKHGFYFVKDVRMGEHLQGMANQFRDDCRIPQILTSGDWCLMHNNVSVNLHGNCIVFFYHLDDVKSNNTYRCISLSVFV